MKDKAFYEKQLQESSEVRFDINETHRPQMKHLGRIFRYSTGKPAKVFKLIKDLMYYRGGYPKETSPAKISVLVDRFVNMCTFFSILEIEEDIFAQLKEAGITITVDPSVIQDAKLELEGKAKTKFNKSWKAAFGGKVVPETVHQILEEVFDNGISTQKTICKMADEIKVDAADKIIENCDISKSVFVKAVNIKYKTMKQKPIDKDIKKLEKRGADTQDGIIDEFK